MKPITICIIILFLNSCSYSRGDKNIQNFFTQEEILQNKTFQEIENQFGKPINIWIDNKNTIAQYSYLKNNYDLISYLPIINHFGWINSRNLEIILVFDGNQKLIDIKKFVSLGKSRNSLICNPKIYSCLKQIKNFTKK